MSTRRLEEVLEECLSAYLDGRRSIEQNLSLYPSLAPELEPLLRTATRVSSTLGQYTPPRPVQQRGLNRFLSDARVRRDLEVLKASGRRSWVTVFFQKYRLGLAGAAMAAVVLAAAVAGSIMVGGGDSGGSSAVSNPSSTSAPAPAAVINLNNAIQNIRDKGTNVQASDIQQLKKAAEGVRQTSAEEIGPVKDTVAQQLAAAVTLVASVAANQPEVAPAAQEAKDTIREVAAGIGVPLPTAPAAVTPAATETPGPTPTITPVPTVTPTPEATTTATGAPTPTLPPPPSDSPPPREPAGFAP